MQLVSLSSPPFFCSLFFFFLMIRRPPRSTHCISSAASDVYKRQVSTQSTWDDEEEDGNEGESVKCAQERSDGEEDEGVEREAEEQEETGEEEKETEEETFDWLAVFWAEGSASLFRSFSLVTVSGFARACLADGLAFIGFLACDLDPLDFAHPCCAASVAARADLSLRACAYACAAGM
eukprot:TRINITY_DN1067_c0_g1_i1.p3 TRINITY_DN1067_c0_g1~~TRINITY_DN1067_c0_g1_i1.p3  ORF type:complete len:179 (+),score=25.92 TRINITY_DN1067_c0_g1_i1:78-614(+)